MGKSNGIINGTISPYFRIDPPGAQVQILDGSFSVERFKFDTTGGTMKTTINYIGGTKVLIDFFSQAGRIGKIEYNGTGTFYRATSDIRTKENIKPITHHYDILDKLYPCNFKFKTSDVPDVDGFIADEVFKIYPIAVSGRPGGLKQDGSPRLSDKIPQPYESLR